MAVLAECPACHKKQGMRNKVCKCGQNMDSAKEARKVRYWLSYYLPSGKQRREICDSKNPYSKRIAETAHGKRVAQKYENPGVLEKVPDQRMTLNKLAEWYLDLKSVKKLRSYSRTKRCIDNFNAEYGNRIVSTIMPTDLENYQDSREKDGAAPATMDMELTWVKAMIAKAFDNDKVSGTTLKRFRTYTKRLEAGTNARKRTLTFGEYSKILKEASKHLRPILTTAMYTGMRGGELAKLKWSHIDRDKWVIRLPKDATKEKKDKTIPINKHVKEMLQALPRHIGHNYVFTYRGKPFSVKGGFKKAFERACDRANVPFGRKADNGVTFHDIRRTVKTNMVNASVSKVYRDRILGHSLKGMDENYIQPSEEDLHWAIGVYTEWVDARIPNSDQNSDQVQLKAV